MRTPRTLLRDLGGAGFAAFHVFVGGSVITALIFPLFLAVVLWRLASGTPLFDSWFGWLHGFAFFGGIFASAFIWVVGLLRRGLVSNVWVVALAPLHWLLLSVAAWRALLQLIHDPYRWEKTEHGLAKSSRCGRPPIQRTLAEERAVDLVSRFRSSHHPAAPSFANFGIEGH
jgi:hypothetical protein